MAIDGVSKLTRVQLAKLSLDYTKQVVEIGVQVALIDPESGVTAFAPLHGNVWSAETHAILRQFMDSLESDISRVFLVDGNTAPRAVPQRKEEPEGVGERYAKGDGVPSI